MKNPSPSSAFRLCSCKTVFQSLLWKEGVPVSATCLLMQFGISFSCFFLFPNMFAFCLSQVSYDEFIFECTATAPSDAFLSTLSSKNHHPDFLVDHIYSVIPKYIKFWTKPSCYPFRFLLWP